MGKEKRPRKPEYKLILTPCLYEREQTYKTRIVIETVKQFASFQYDLAVEEKASPTTIHYRILGLKTPQLSLPASGPAQFRKEYTSLKGRVDIVVEGLDKIVHVFTFRISQKEVRILHQPPDMPVEVVLGQFLIIPS